MEKPGHLRGGLQITIGIFCKQAAGGFQSAVIPDRGEHIENLAFFRHSVANAVGCHQWKLKRFGKSDRLLIDGFLFTIVMTL